MLDAMPSFAFYNSTHHNIDLTRSNLGNIGELLSDKVMPGRDRSNVTV